MKNKISILIIVSVLFSLVSCNSNPPVPKPRGYFRIDLPEKEYKMYDDDCPFTFELPVYAFIIKEKEDYCWMDLYFPLNKATVYLTYKTINNDLNAHLEDAHEFAYKHTVKADAIEEIRFENDSLRLYGMMYNLKGNTASQVQFYLTDSTTHFLRGSLYFNVAPNKDSLAPVIDFIRADIEHLMESLRWK
jgi:gliding motility-associated lipoprotein GldD